MREFVGGLVLELARLLGRGFVKGQGTYQGSCQVHLMVHRYHHTDTDTDTRLMIHTDTDTAQASIPIPIQGIFTNNIPGIGIGTIPINIGIGMDV